VIAVDRDTFGFPSDGRPTVGNCFSACVASLLELPLSDVPQFMTGDDWWAETFLPWLAAHGWWAAWWLLTDRPAPPGLYILTGHSPRRPEDRSKLHSVVARGHDVVHDPHPSRDGVLTADDVVVLVPLDPAAGAPGCGPKTGNCMCGAFSSRLDAAGRCMACAERAAE
jgi:hypothetical protein